MGREDKIRNVTELLGRTDSAHHSFEIKVLKGDRDIRWPEWYAEYLIGHGLDLLMEDRLTTEMLANFIQESKTDYRSCDSKLTWEEFAAARIVEKLV